MEADQQYFDMLRQEIEADFAHKEVLQPTAIEPQEPVEQQTSEEKEELPDVLQIMQAINKGELHYSNVDWVLQIKTMLQLCSMMPTKFPYVMWLWGLLGAIDDPTTRMDILGKMQSAAPDCFEDLNERQLFISDCSCIYQICMRVRAYNLRDDIGVRETWTDERKSLNDLAHVLSDKMIEPKWMVAIAEEMYRASQGDTKQAMLTLVLRANRNIGHLSINNIVDFAKNLYIAEGFRQLILEGKEDSLDVPTIDDFNWELRNACFDVYIELRKEQIKEQLNKINRRIKGASDIDCLEKLLELERAVVDRENGLEQFRGSAAYNAMWYPGRQIVLDMLNIFIEYLNMYINEEKEKGTPKSGKKEVHLHIDHVENLAMGDNVDTKIVKSDE